MGSYVLCQPKKATKGYYLESISTNIFSIEELCFFLYHNIYLLDDTIINEALCQWIGRDLGFKSLGAKLSSQLREGIDIEGFVLPIFKEINYLSHEEYKSLGIKLEQLDEQPAIVKDKLKGDCLIRYGKYINGLKVYQDILKKVEETNLGGQFNGTVYHNMGCAYARLFQMDEARECLRKACELLHTKAAIKSYLGILHMTQTVEEFDKEALRLGVDDNTKAEIINELKMGETGEVISSSYSEFQKAKEDKEQGDSSEYYRTMDLLLEKMTKEYHNNTGF